LTCARRAGGANAGAYNRRIRSISLTNRIFLACTLLATASLGFAFAYVNARASREAEAEIRRGIVDASAIVGENHAALSDTFTRLARLVADLPKLKAAVATADAPTVQPLADEYRTQMKAGLLVLTGHRGERLGTSGPAPATLPDAIAHASPVEEVSTFWIPPHGLAQIVSVPILLEGEPPDILGRLTVGFGLDDALAAQWKRQTGSEIAFGADGRILASSLPASQRDPLARLLGTRDIEAATIGDEDFLGIARPLLPRPASPGAGPAPIALVLQSRTDRLRFLNTLRTGLIATLVVTLLLSTLVSYGVARTVTRPLSAITRAMREVAATGDLTRKVLLRSGRWDDEDAKLLATTFNTLTESIARFQTEAGQRERLSALGRLSTVIAHEIRNPLMIIKTALLSLRDGASDEERHEAVADIREEADRLNRIVTDVLDFAKPIHFELAPADLNAVCRASADAAWAGGRTPAVRLDLDESIPPMMTDAERLRTALVNILTNARHAVDAAPDGDVCLSTRQAGGQATITVRDTGPGIAPDDLVHIFDPYFTTRKAGTGLGLPIARNIIEGLRGTISVHSREREGTEIRIDLPAVQPETAA